MCKVGCELTFHFYGYGREGLSISAAPNDMWRNGLWYNMESRDGSTGGSKNVIIIRMGLNGWKYSRVLGWLLVFVGSIQ